MVDASQIFAEHVAGIRYEDIPSEVVEIAKKSILDTLGVTLGAGSIVQTIKRVVEIVKEMGGNEESTIIGFGGKAPAYMAAFANGAMAHYLDYDDLHYLLKFHPSSSAVPAGFAIAERLGSVRGVDFLTAIALGQDVSSRIALAATWNLTARPVWHISPLCGVFGATATSGRLLGLDAEEMVNAFGLTLLQTAGTMELRYGTGSDFGGLYAAFSAKAGVLSGLMAQKGITASKNSLEGKAGFFNAYFNGEYNRDGLLADLGKRFEGINIGFKFWPACGQNLSYIEATISIVSEHDILPEEIEEITVYVHDFSQPLCEPREERLNPRSSMDAKFSLPYGVAVAAAYRKVLLKDYTPEGIKNQVVLDLAQKVKPKFEPRFNVVRAFPPGMVEIRTKGGQTYSEKVDIPYGHPQKPFTMEKLIEKFKDCASYSVRPLPEENIERVIHLVSRLEEVEDVSQIIKLLA